MNSVVADQRSPRIADSQRCRDARVHPRYRVASVTAPTFRRLCAGERPAGRLHSGHEAAERVHTDRRERGQANLARFQALVPEDIEVSLRTGPVRNVSAALVSVLREACSARC